MFFLLAGLLIGFTLGYHDLFVLMGAGKKNKFTTLFLITFVIIAIFWGATTNINGPALFVGKLANTKQIQVASIIEVSALVTIVFLRLRFRLISVSHAVIGSIVGWLLFVNDNIPLDSLLSVVIIWLITPILAGVFSAIYLSLLKLIMRRLRLHILKVGRILQVLVLILLLVSAYSFGANNVANVIGPYLSVFEDSTIHISNWTVPLNLSITVLGAASIIMGLMARIVLKRKKTNVEIFEFSPEANFSVLFSFATVFFLFSSSEFQDLIEPLSWSFVLVPISAMHVLTAGVVGVSYKKGFNIYQKDTFAGLAIGSVLTPVLSGLITFVSAIAFRVLVGSLNLSNGLGRRNGLADVTEFFSTNGSSSFYNVGIVVALSGIIILGIVIYSGMKKRFELERRSFFDNKAELEAEKEFFKQELEYTEKQAGSLQQEIDFKNKELERFAFNLVEKEELFKKLKDVLSIIKQSEPTTNNKKAIRVLSDILLNNFNLRNERASFYKNIDEINESFYIRLSQQFNSLTDNDKKLIALLKIGLSSKEIASLISISTKSVEMNRYRLRKKLNLLNDQSLLEFVKNI